MSGEANVSAREALNALLTERPRFHGREQAGSRSFPVAPPVLAWILNHVPAGGRTLETGCGYSTILLTALAAEHTTVSPFVEEHALIVAWCARHDVSTRHLRLIASASQDALPALHCRDLDFVLIDGDHAFPAPFIDWYYTADAIRPGGFVAVDDTQIPTGGILREFLNQETGRWRRAEEIGRTVIFQRVTAEPVARGVGWTEQPYCQLTAARPSLLTRLATKMTR